MPVVDLNFMDRMSFWTSTFPRLYWWNDASWVACSDTGVNTVDNFIWAKIRADTVPNLSQLIGSPFGSSWDD